MYWANISLVTERAVQHNWLRLFYLIPYAKVVDEKKLVGTLFIDLSKAFDTISHSTLITKLPAYWIRDDELKWFTDYLFCRSQIVNLNKTCSEAAAVRTGVPQGSLLGPLLFTIFFNDLVYCLQKAQVIKYADDTVLYFSHTNFLVIENNFERRAWELIILLHWKWISYQSQKKRKRKVCILVRPKDYHHYQDLLRLAIMELC